MAIGDAGDFTIYQDEFFSGMTEVEAQNVNAFNAASNGCIKLVPQLRLGDFNKEQFFDLISGLIIRRDTTAVTAATDLPMTTSENIGVKVNRTIGPVTQTLDAFRKVLKKVGGREMSRILGRQIATAKLKDQLGSAIRAGEAAIGANTAMVTDGSAGQLTHVWLNTALRKFGDRSPDIACLVMHSGAYHDLLGQAIGSSGFDGIASASIKEGTVATMGRPVVVTDDASLITGAGSTERYITLGLVPGAITIEDDSEAPTIVTDIVTGLLQLVQRIQGEFAYNVNVKGFQWDVTNGGANPSDAAVATGTNWDQVATSDKDTAGIHLTNDSSAT